jgi:ferrous-iron efflux pump FieF
MESRGTGMGEGLDVTFQERELVEKVKGITNEIAGADRCHNVHVRQYGEKRSLSLHCHFEEELSIVQIHDLTTRIEERLKERIPGVERVLVHAEPENR